MNPARTDRLDLAAFLSASRRLRFLRCEPNGSGRLAFVFDGPQAELDRLQVSFDAGAEAPAAALLDSLKRLRKVMTEVQKSKGAYEYEYRR